MTDTKPAFHVEPDGDDDASDGDLILWDDTDPARPREVAYLYGHLARNVAVSSRHGSLVWQVLTSVLAPDEATRVRVAGAVHNVECSCTDPQHLSAFPPYSYMDIADAVLAVLAALRAPADQGGAS